MATIRVSRQGLTRCPACGRHIRFAESVALTACPFCGSGLSGVAKAKAAIVHGARGGILAAGLMGALACESSATGTSPAGDTTGGDSAVTTDVASEPDVVDPGEDTVEPAEDIGAQPEYGLPPMDVEEPEDIPVQPLYGGPPDTVTTDDVPIQPLYGAPSDIVESDDVPVQPLYGAPPDDISESDASDTSHDVVEDAGPGPVPLYGLPPSPDGNQ